MKFGFNKAQQDVLLPDVEAGTVRLIGATTHNPFSSSTRRWFRVRRFLNSDRSRRKNCWSCCDALADPERGLGHMKLRVDDDALKHLAKFPMATPARR